jgi:hypothetical protein
MGKSRGWPLEAPFTTHDQVVKCWDGLSLRQKGIVKEHMSLYDMTMWQVLNRWPALRVERKFVG